MTDQPDAMHAATDVHVGQLLGGRYRLVEKRTERDHIAWWDGIDETLSRPVTIYVMPPTHPRMSELLGVARQAGAATDPRFLRVLDVLAFDPLEPISLIVCEDIPGVDLQTLLKRGPLAALDAAWVIGEVTAAMAPLHEAGLSHGEISPTTVMLTTTGAVRIKGFMLFPALAGQQTGDAMTRERADVAAIGRLFYACLTGAWPDTKTPDPPKTFGLPPARWRNDELVTPSEIRPGIPPVLDAICTQIIQPRSGATPLRTAASISIALRRVLGTADASADLASRVAETLAPTPAPHRAAIDETTARNASANSETKPPSGPQSPPARTPSAPSSAPSPARTRKPAEIAQVAARWLVAHWWVPVAAIVLIIVISLLAHSCAPPAAPVVTPEPTPESLQITAVTELDAKNDGGDGQDNPDQVPLATDGQVNTCWTSERYTTDYIPTKKPGIGLVLSLAGAHEVTSLTLTLVAVPAGLSIMVPTDPTLVSPPLDSVKEWTSITDVMVNLSPQEVTLPVDTTTSFILLYFTSLPRSSDRPDRVQASVCEVSAVGYQ